MRNKFFWIFSMGIFFLSCQDKEQRDRNFLAEKLDSLLLHEHESNRFDGTVMIGSRDSIFYRSAIGTANRVWNIPMQSDYRFDICSLNKSFVATLILLAAEERRLSLDDRLVDLLGSYKFQGKFDEEITIHHMLTHTSGLPDYDAVKPELSEDRFKLFKRKHFSNEEYVDFISRLTPKDRSGQQFYYSNFAYNLLSIILEDVYQTTFPELLNEKICQPLQLNQTFSTLSNEEVHLRRVEGYNFDREDSLWKRNQFIDLSLGRRIFSTAEDLYKWAKAMDDTALLNQKSLTLMQSNHLTDITKDVSYGYGWAVFDGKGEYQMGDLNIDRNYIIHGGATEGFKSMLVNIENGDLIIAILANTGDQTNEILLTQNIVEILMKERHEN